MAAEQPGDAIAVTGDVTVDWIIATPPELKSNLQLPYLWDQPGTVAITSRPGGAALIAEFLQSFGSSAVLTPAVAVEALRDPMQRDVARSFSAWSHHQRKQGSTEQCWRMREFLGQAPAAGTPGPARVPAARVVVIDDSNMGFRDSTSDWGACFAGLSDASSVVMRMTPPLASGALWEHVLNIAGARLTLICTVGDLRREDAAIGEPLSWERTASQVAVAVRARSDLRDVARVVVTIGLAGAVVVEPNKATLVYDAQHQEGDWESLRPGLVFGVGSAVTAAVAAALRVGGDAASGVAQGLAAARASHEGGVAPSDRTTTYPLGTPQSFARHPVGEGLDWKLMDEAAGGDLEGLAGTALMRGIDAAAAGVPIERMGGWTSIDREEIEGMRAVRNTLSEYLQQPAPARPLSIAVFGPPGSGKSFAVKQMTSQLATGARALHTLEFNLSQFEDQATLSAAFQCVRDCAVERALPLVFWDEFDSARGGRELGWLASFLAPMQDGLYLDGADPRPIGPAIFVFAGGTHATMESFKKRAPEVKGAKATDFSSRLRGYINVLGPNPSEGSVASPKIRRALLLRQSLLRRAPQLFREGELSIDPGVARAFLGVGNYAHGARSMDAIVEMSALSGRSRFGRASLPAPRQLSLHVDPAEFFALVGD